MNDPYVVLRSVWFTPQSPMMHVGVVAIESGNKWKAYIGLAGGKDQNLDEQFIAAFGAKIVDNRQAEAFFPDLNVEDFTI